jgi:hypothetical protein
MVAANCWTVRPHAQEVCSSPDTVLEFKSRLVGEPTRNAILIGQLVGAIRVSYRDVKQTLSR